MKYRIVADSCCDLTPELKQQLEVTTVPLNMMLGDRTFVDDEQLDLPHFMEEMKQCKDKVGSSSPSPALYAEAFEPNKTTFAVTLSGNLSSSYSSALIGKEMAEDEGADVHVFDSKSASAGELLLVMKIRELIDGGSAREEIVATINSFVKKMKTYFVLENLDNLVKNGRLGLVTGKLLSMLHIRPIMSSDGDGNIIQYSTARGRKQVIQKLVDTVEQSGRTTEGERMVITHCNNPQLAERLRDALLLRYSFSEIVVVATRGISSLYANDQGIIMAY